MYIITNIITNLAKLKLICVLGDTFTVHDSEVSPGSIYTIFSLGGGDPKQTGLLFEAVFAGKLVYQNGLEPTRKQLTFKSL